MAHYRSSFPHATVLPKMHILKDHVIQWLRRWHVGAGVMGEQGAESLHAHPNKLEEDYILRHHEPPEPAGVHIQNVQCRNCSPTPRTSP